MSFKRNVLSAATGAILSVGLAGAGAALAEGDYGQQGQMGGQNQGMNQDQQAQQNMQQMDQDRSGDLTYDEFEQGGQQMQQDYGLQEEQADEQFTQENFDRYDMNDDDLWDEEEYGTWYDDAGDEGFWDV